MAFCPSDILVTHLFNLMRRVRVLRYMKLRGGMNSIPDVFSASRPNRNSKMARLVDEIHDLRMIFAGNTSLLFISFLIFIIF